MTILGNAKGRSGNEANGITPPLPPEGGWTLLEAAKALCPSEASLFAAGGKPLDVAVRAWMGELSQHLDPVPELWLGDVLLAALYLRPDLVLTGRDLTQGMHAQRLRLPHDALVASQSQRGSRGDEARGYLTLRLNEHRAKIAYDFPVMLPNLPDDVELLDVRVEVRELPPSASEPKMPPLRQPTVKQVYSDSACRAWLRLRVATWPSDRAPSTAEQCLADARVDFSGPIARDAFRILRRGVVPAAWRSPGPRVSRD
jgi:hypothetical protein